MRLIKSEKANENYLTKIVQIDSFYPHPNAEKLKQCLVDGFNIITSIDTKPGLYVYFPVLSQISSSFLSFANLYRHKELNRDPEKLGMFEDNGRVKVITLRGESSEGFIIPAKVLENYLYFNFKDTADNIKNGVEFDTIEYNNKTYPFSQKYIIPVQNKKNPCLSSIRDIPINCDQFRFNYDTTLIKKCPWIIQPDTVIHMSHKWHGTSAISAYLICHSKLKWYQKIIKRLTGKSYDKYDYIYSSRRKIRNGTEGLYTEADKIIRPWLTPGLTVYYEIVGYEPTGRAIQGKHDYGCVPPKKDEPYTYKKHFDIRVYRITYTDENNKVLEYTPVQVYKWCGQTNLRPVVQCYYGKAKDLYPQIPIDKDWNTNFIKTLSRDKQFYMEEDSPDCKNKVPHEGLVIKLMDRLEYAYKLKCIKFLEYEGKQVDSSQENLDEDI